MRLFRPMVRPTEAASLLAGRSEHTSVGVCTREAPEAVGFGQISPPGRWSGGKPTVRVNNL